MSATHKVGVIRTALLRVPTTSFRSSNNSSALGFSSATFDPSASARECSNVNEGVGLGEKTKERVKNAVDAAKDAAQNIKDKVAGKAAAAGEDGKGCQQEQPTDSSVEDLRKRPGGYS